MGASALRCGLGEIVRARPWREFQNVHVTARIDTPCHSIVVPSLLIVYTNCSRTWHDNFVVTPWEKF